MTERTDPLATLAEALRQQIHMGPLTAKTASEDLIAGLREQGYVLVDAEGLAWALRTVAETEESLGDDGHVELAEFAYMEEASRWAATAIIAALAPEQP